MERRVARFWALQLLWLVLPVSALIAAYLGYAHIRLTHGLGSFESICLLGEMFDCDAVNTSRYSELFGVPISFFALPLYAVMLFLVQPATFETQRGRKARRALSLLALWVVGFSGFLAWKSAVEIEAWCLFCVGLYAAHSLVLLLVLIPPGARLPGLPAGRELVWSATIFTTLMLSVGLGSTFFAVQLDQMAMVDLELAATESDSVRLQFEERPGGKVKLSTVVGDAPPADHNPSTGPLDAEVVVVEFADFECGHCRKLRSTMAPIKERYAEQVRFVFKHFPMDKACNPHLNRTHHARACAAAYASQCAEHQGAFWPYHDLLFKNQKSLEDEDLRHYAESLGLDLGEFDACLASDRVREEVGSDLTVGGELALSGIPRTYVNRRQFRGAVSSAILDAAIRVELGEVALDAEGRVETRREIAVGTPLSSGVVEMSQIQVGKLEFWMDAVEAGLSTGGGAVTVAGESPASASWSTADKACRAAGKRTCSQEEWLAACTGHQPVDSDGDGAFVDDYLDGRMYPYGEHYMRGVCWDSGDPDKNGVLATGKRGACKSPEGVYDLVGNIEEWVGRTPESAALVGGGWSAQDRASCGASSVRFGAGYQSSGTGFRCCADTQIAGGSTSVVAVEDPFVEVGMKLPELSGLDLAGEPVEVVDFSGKVVLVNFWASWCVPCERELLFLARLQREIGQGLQVLSINVDRDSDQARPILARLQLPFPVLMDADADMLARFNASSLPMNVLVGAKGEVLERHAGFDDVWARDVRKHVTELLEAQ
ncbi:MAG: thioredoxin domain-containing protein [Myxococcota bacterium]|nr:thioredoxin domain-containing protein [Myxococcota bacterium]